MPANLPDFAHLTISEAKAALTKTLAALYDTREAKNIAQWALEEILQMTNVQLMLKEAQLVPDESVPKLERVVKRLLKGSPVQYVLGVADFYGLRLKVTPQVLIPRPETEELVDLMLKQNSGESISMLDIGTGSGCIPVALKKDRPEWKVSAIDVSDGALKVARQNAKANELLVEFDKADFLDKTEWQNLDQYDLIVSNPPYVSKAELKGLEPHVREFEPTIALSPDGEDPLIFYRMIAEFAGLHLKEGGKVYLELNPAYAEDIAGFFSNAQIIKDMQGRKRMLVAEG